MKRGWRTLPVLLALAASPGAGAAEPGAWQCNFCTYASGWYGALDIGGGWASGEDAKFSDYRGIEDEGGFLSFYGNLHYRGEHGAWLDVLARDLGTRNRRLVVRGGREGRYELRFSFREIPKHRGFATKTPFAGTGSDVLSLSSSPGSATLRTLRKEFDAGLRLNLAGKWSYQLDFRRMEKSGTRPFGAGVFTLQSSVFPAPVDFNNNRVDMALEYSAKNRLLRLGFTSSVFNNRNAAVTWENPFTPLGNTQWLRAALEPDSSFRQFSVRGVLKPARNVRFSGDATLGRIRQDGALLPYSINPDFEDIPLPRASLDQSIDSSTFRLGSRMSARLSPKLDFNARLKIDERDNRTPVDRYTPVITDLLPRTETPNRPYSFERRHYTAELGFRARPATRLLAGFGRKERERSLQSVRQTTEDTWWGEANFDHWSAAQLRLRLESTRRDISPYRTVNDPGLQENPLMRKFNLADLDRTRAVVELELAPGDSLSASLVFHASQDDYDRSIVGLMESEDRSINLDLGYSPTQHLGFHLFITRDEISSSISGVDASRWRATTSDRFLTAGAGVNGRLGNRTGFSVDYLSSDSKGRILTDSGAGEDPFPLQRTRLRNASVSLSYRVSERWGWTLQAEHERYRSADWQVDGLGVDGIDAILTLGPESPDYSVTVIRLTANFRFQ